MKHNSISETKMKTTAAKTVQARREGEAAVYIKKFSLGITPSQQTLTQTKQEREAAEQLQVLLKRAYFWTLLLIYR
jgi:hypothetical protein